MLMSWISPDKDSLPSHIAAKKERKRDLKKRAVHTIT
jgi:hypothetical protein